MAEFQIYKSSAGSGKTTTLIQNFLILSLGTDNPGRFKKVLAITFTNKAAAEMKDRLIEELEKLSDIRRLDPEHFMVKVLTAKIGISLEKLSQRAAAMFELVLHDYSDLHIGTIDQFNHRLIRSFSRDLNLKSDFEVELKEKELFREAVARLVEKVGQDPFITRHLVNYTRFKLDNEKKAYIERDLENLRSLVMSEDAVEALEALHKIDRSEFDAAGNTLRAIKTKAQNAIRKPAEKALETLEAAGVEPGELPGKSRGIGIFLIKAADFPEGEPNFEAAYIDKTLESGWTVKSTPAGVVAAVEPVSDTLTACLADIVEAHEKLGPEYYLADAILQNIDLIAILEEVSRCLDELCEERNILPISRFNKIISRALRREPVSFLYEQYGNRFNHILIDEYQDTSELQWFNILPLIDESLAKGSSSMVVGDAKQSIYRWRGGKAEQLIALPQLIDPPEDLRSAVAQNLVRSAIETPLNTNYRSKPNIVKFNNAFFSRLGKAVIKEDSLYETEYLPENLEQKYNASEDQPGFVQVEFLGEKPEAELKCERLIENIRTFKKAGYAYRDIAILVRTTKNDGRMFLDAMQESGIPVSTAESFEVDKDIRVKLVLAFLRLTTDPDNSAAKISVMRCLEELRSIPFEPHKYLVKNSKSGKNKIDLKSYLKANNLKDYQTIEQSKGVFERAEALISTYLPGETNVFLNGFLNILISNVGISGSAYAFFEWWNGLSEKPSIPEGGDIDAVQFMTIHKSKGLQFKVVLLPNLSWILRPVKNELKWFDLQKHSVKVLPYAPLALNSRLEKQNLGKEWGAEEAASNFDNLNMLYVALTRAVDALCISYSEQDKGNTGNWITGAMASLLEQDHSEMNPMETDEFPDGSFTLKIGSLNPATVDDSTEVKPGDIPWINAAGIPWSENVRVAPILKNKGRVRGIWFHKIIAQSITEYDLEAQLEAVGKSGDLDEVELKQLRDFLKRFYSDPKFAAMRKNAKVLSERDLYYRGEILRPDLVLESDTQINLIDFKTGIEKPGHKQQLRDYRDALREISQKPIESFLLYTDPYKWVEVETNQQGQTRLF